MRRREFIAGLSAAAAWPVPTRAQQPGKTFTVGVLWHAASAEEEGPYFNGLVQGFADLGYTEGRNIRLEHRFPNEVPERFKSMAAELASSNVDVMMSVGGPASVHAKNASSTVPLVFLLVADPVGLKLVNSLAKPGGNVTGLASYASDVIGRRLQLFKEVVPGLSRIGQLINPNAPSSRPNAEEIRMAAEQLGLTVKTFEARSLADLSGTFDALKHAGMQGVTFGPNEGIPFQGRALIAKLAIEHRLGVCAISREIFEPGALMSYGTDQVAICRRGAVYVDKIRNGAKPADLPVEGPTKFEFLINLKTAKAIGVEVPAVVLARADEVIE